MRPTTTLRWLLIPLAVFTLGACDSLRDYLALPTSDLSGTYLDTAAVFANACGANHPGVITLSITTETSSPAEHQLSMSVTIPGLGHASTGTWTVPGTRPDFSANVDGLGIVTMQRKGSSFAGSLTTTTLECGEEIPNAPATGAFLAERL